MRGTNVALPAIVANKPIFELFACITDGFSFHKMYTSFPNAKSSFAIFASRLNSGMVTTRTPSARSLRESSPSSPAITKTSYYFSFKRVAMSYTYFPAPPQAPLVIARAIFSFRGIYITTFFYILMYIVHEKIIVSIVKSELFIQTTLLYSVATANYNSYDLSFVGDVFFWTFALWLTLYLRYFEIPETHSMLLHASAFGFIFILWVIVFFIAGLYANQTLLVKSKIPATILRAQIANSIIAVFFFYFIPYFGLTPKTTLFLDLIISFGLVLLWRIYLFDHLVWGRRHRAVIIGGGNATKELCAEINNNPRYRLRVEPMDLRGDATIDRLKKEKIRFVILNPRDDEVKYLSSKLSALMLSKVNFIDIHDIYEDIFGREPLSLINDNWFLENISGSQKIAYGLFKRIIDIGIAFFL